MADARPGSSGDFLLERLHSLTGVVPLGVFLIEHLFGNSFAVRAWGGPEAYNRYVIFLLGTPYVKGFLEAILVFIPLAFHGWYGLRITAGARSNVDRYPTERNWAYVAQRISGLALAAYLVVHVFRERFASGLSEWASAAAGLSGAELAAWHRHATAPYEVLAAHLANPVYYWFSVIGLLSATLHFSNGLWSFAVRFGIVVGPRAQANARYACGALFVGLSLAGLSALRSFTELAK